MKRLVWAVAILALVGSVAIVGRQYAPGLWVKFERAFEERFGWTEEAKQRDPGGYVEYVIHRLRKDLAELAAIRQDLLVQIAELTSKIQTQDALASHAERLATEFRNRYREARVGNTFPVVIRGAAYTADQVESQVSLLLAQARGCREALERLKKVREQAEAQLEMITVCLNRTEAELAALTAQRKLLQARQIFDQQSELLAQVEDLFAENKRVVATNPVRTVQELLAAAETPTPEQLRREEVERFLNEEGAVVELASTAHGGQSSSPEGTNTQPALNTPPVEESAQSEPAGQPPETQESPAETPVGPTAEPGNEEPPQQVAEEPTLEQKPDAGTHEQPKEEEPSQAVAEPATTPQAEGAPAQEPPQEAAESAQEPAREANPRSDTPNPASYNVASDGSFTTEPQPSTPARVRVRPAVNATESAGTESQPRSAAGGKKPRPAPNRPRPFQAQFD